jgi:hypothetical protein
MNKQELRQLIKEEISKVINELTSEEKHREAALELVNIAKSMLKKSDSESYTYMDSIKRQTKRGVKDHYDLTECYELLRNTLMGDANDEDFDKFPEMARKIIEDKYGLEIKTPWGEPMVWSPYYGT